MATITLDKTKLYIQIEHSASSGCRNRISELVKKISHNFQAKQLIQRDNYNPQIKNLLKCSVGHTKPNQCNKHRQTASKHVATHPTRFKRGR